MVLYRSPEQTDLHTYYLHPEEAVMAKRGC